MKQNGFAFKALCYNSSMSEKGEGLYSELSHPHTGDPRVDPNARGIRIKPRRRSSFKKLEEKRMEEEAMGQGFFPIEQPASAVETPTTMVSQPEALRDRALRFEEGAPVFRVIYKDEKTDDVVIPRTSEQANDMFLGRLPMRLELPVDRSCLEKGKRGGTIIRCVGKSVFGAFTIVHYPAFDENGEEIEIPVLADMRNRTSKKDNEVLRFRREVSGENYYLGLPRTSPRRNS